VGIVKLIGVILFSMVVASFITPIAVYLFNKLELIIASRRSSVDVINPVDTRTYHIGSVYIPKYIKNLGKPLDSLKSIIKYTIKFKQYYYRITNPLPQYIFKIVKCPFYKLTLKQSKQTIHSGDIIDGTDTKSKQNHPLLYLRYS